MEEFFYLVRLRLVERGGYRVGLGVRFHLLRRSPIGASGIQWIQHDVSTAGVVKPLDILAGGVIYDGRITPASDLTKALHDELRFSNPGVAHELKMLRLFLQRNPHHLAGFRGFEADTIALLRPIELFRREHERPAQDAAILHIFEPLNVLRDRQPKHQSKADATLDKADGEHRQMPLSAKMAP